MFGLDYVCKEDCDALDAVLHEFQPWSKEWHACKDGVDRIWMTEPFEHVRGSIDTTLMSGRVEMEHFAHDLLQ